MRTSTEHLNSFTWSIENFSLCQEDNLNKIYSPPFILDTLKTTSCRLALCPNYSDDYIGLYFIVEGCLDYCEVGYELSVIDINNSKHSIFKRTVNLLRWSETGCSSLISRKDLFTKKKFLLPSDVLTVRCEINVCDLCVEEIDNPDSLKDISKLSEDLFTLLNRSNSFDWLLNIGIEKIYLHKTILKSRCPEILKVLEQNSHGESSSDVVQSEEVFPSFDCGTIKALMKYIYSGTLDTSTRNLRNSLAIAADVFNLPDLASKLFPIPTHVCARTSVNSVCIPITCPINDFSTWKVGEKHFYPFHNSKLHSWAQFSLIVSLKKDASGKEKVVIYISPELESDEQVSVNCTISLLGIDKNVTVIGTGHHLFSSNKQWKFPTIICKNYLNNRKELYLQGDILKFHCVLSATNGKFDSVIQSTAFSSNAYNRFEKRVCCIKTFQDDLRKLFLSETNADVVLVAEDKKHFAHEAVLLARSSVFFRLLEQKKKSSPFDLKFLEISDMSADVLELILRYVYFADVDIQTPEMAAKLSDAAERYGLQALVEKCVSFLNGLSQSV